MSRHVWDEAVEAFTSVDSQDRLAPEDLEQLAEAYWWSGDPDGAVEAWERAFGAYVDGGQKSASALVGLKLAEFAFRRGAVSVGAGWMTRAERLLEHEPPSSAHGWLAVQRSGMAMLVDGDPLRGEMEARQALDIADEHGDAELRALALSAAGTATVRQGRWEEGMALIDEAAASAGSGELRPKTACDVYCITISTCCEASDFRRAAEWTDQVDRWMQRQAIRGYRGECRLHRAELKRRQGAWSDAEKEARDACRELESFRLMDSAGLAHYEIGEIRLRMGDLEGAEASFAAAYALGHDWRPGLALVSLARGDVAGAVAGMKRILRTGSPVTDGVHAGGDMLGRAMILPSAVEVALAAGDLEGAAAATDELSAIADTYDAVSLAAAVQHARGALALTEGRPDDAVSELDQALRLWRKAGTPYEAARTRLLLGRARAAAGDETSSRLDLLGARAEFTRLGAKLDLREVEELLGGRERESTGPVHKAFVFTDIVASTEIVEAIGDDAWQDVLAWHDRVLREEFGRHGGEVVKHTGDGFFVVFDDAEGAVTCAVSVQRRLTAHRRQHGFAPQVRMGIHAAEARSVGDDYTGQAVHIASRVAALAGGSEILISDAVRDAVINLQLDVSEGRSATLKGVRQPVEVLAVGWQDADVPRGRPGGSSADEAGHDQ